MKLPPGFSFSWKRALGITRARQRWARETGIPTTRSGLERKVGRTLMRAAGGWAVVGVIIYWLFFGGR